MIREPAEPVKEDPAPAIRRTGGREVALVLAGGCLVLLGFAEEIPLWQAADRLIQEASLAWRGRGLEALMTGISFLGDGRLIAPLALALGVGLRARLGWQGLWELIGVLVATAAVQISLKFLVARSRPGEWGYGFPSGHAALATAFYVVAWLLLQRTGRAWVQRRWPVYACLLFLLLAIGTSRILLQYHWATDVLGGYAVGALSVLLVRGVAEWRGATPGARMTLVSVPLLVAALLGGSAWVRAVEAGWIPARGSWAIHPRELAYQGGALEGLLLSDRDYPHGGFSARLHILPGLDKEVQLVFGYTGPAHYFSAGISGDGRRFCLARRAGSGLMPLLCREGAGLPPPAWFTLRVVTAADAVELYYQGERVLALRELQIPRGRVGLRVWDTMIIAKEWRFSASEVAGRHAP
ncbi:MAG: phosphatase PAP2 family protein [Deltaproteobacteria bacterium]|nr:phosphatase PAP2 family protein [Deltaproteobacteria bacterium]